MTFHASEELAEDGLDIYDAEAAILSGTIQKSETDDPRGIRYTIVGKSVNGKIDVGVVGRFKETGVFLIITVFEATEMQE